MKLKIVGDGAFGSFLKVLLSIHFELVDDAKVADSIVLAVPLSAYREVVAQHRDKHIINVCSVQKPSADIIADERAYLVTSLHPLFGVRTPIDKRHTIVTYKHPFPQHGEQEEFLLGFGNLSTLHTIDPEGKEFTPESHDRLMRRTHLVAVEEAERARASVEAAKDVPDHLIPNSFPRLLRQFVKTLDDMPPGTLSSILANPYK